MKYIVNNLLAFVLLFINIIYAKNDKNLSNDDKKINNDEYYLIFVNNTYGEYQVFSDTRKQKRYDSQIFIESLANEINNLIISNKDTFQNPEKVDEIQEAFHSKKRKRDYETIYNYDESDLVFPISSVNNKVVMKAFLSEELVKKVQKMENIIAVEPNLNIMEYQGHPTFVASDITKNASWKNLKYQENADSHLSLISQGKYDKTLVNQYDDTYYYPGSAGKGVDIYIFDTSFDFDYSEFKNSPNRVAECLGVADSLRFEPATNKKSCGSSSDPHGKLVSDVAAGAIHGVAKEANIYGVNCSTYIDKILGSLEYVRENKLKKYRTIINLSSGVYFPHDISTYTYFSELLGNFHQQGGIVVASAGNEGKNVVKTERGIILKVTPCTNSGVICVGAINNKENVKKENVYQKADFSNYGEEVDIFAPGYAMIEYKHNGEIVKTYAYGTSFSSPIVAGVIANNISNYISKNISFDMDKILSDLYKNALKNVIHYDNRSYSLVNNGKHIVYSKDNTYHGCGLSAGNRPCSKNTKNNRCGPKFGICGNSNQCCSQDGYCGTSNDHCGLGCQSEFGKCSNQCSCEVNPTSRIDCGFLGVDENQCRSKGCCWNPTNVDGAPWCFYTISGGKTTDCGSGSSPAPAPPTTTTTCQVNVNERQDCGFLGIDRQGCINKGCCWEESNISGIPWCFYSKEIKVNPKPKTSAKPKPKTSAKPKPSTTTKKTIPTSTDPDRCGPGYGRCAASNECCSQYNYCGTTAEHCGKGCQSEFGKCSAPSSKKPTPVTKKPIPTSTVSGRCGPEYGKCGHSNECCSQYNYCGTTTDYCGKGCQRSFGKCT